MNLVSFEFVVLTEWLEGILIVFEEEALELWTEVLRVMLVESLEKYVLSAIFGPVFEELVEISTRLDVLANSSDELILRHDEVVNDGGAHRETKGSI